MKILFLTIDDEKRPSTRYRVLKYIHFLVSQGIKCRVMQATTKLKDIFIKIWYIYRSDIVFIQKKTLKKHILNLFLFFNKNIIYDFDDAVYAREPFKEKSINEGIKTQVIIKKLNYMLKKVKYIREGNNTLKNYASKFNKNISVIPSSIIFSEYFTRKKRDKKNIYIGWIGLGANTFYLNHIQPALSRICRLKKNIKLMVISDINFQMQGVSVVNRQWSKEMEIKYLNEIDIGIMPLLNDKWSRGKSAFKIVQYMATGTPVVASAVGANKDIIKDGYNGYLAYNIKDWEKYLLYLIKNKKKRKELGINGRKHIKQYFSTESNVAKLIKIFNKTAT